jgi:hypothetical protein
MIARDPIAAPFISIDPGSPYSAREPSREPLLQKGLRERENLVQSPPREARGERREARGGERGHSFRMAERDEAI